MVSNTNPSSKPRRPLVIDASTTAVVCVECQNGVLGPDSVLPALAADAAGQGLVAGVGRLVTAARAAGALVVHATFGGRLGAVDPGPAPLWRAIASLSEDWTPGHPATEVLADLFDPTDLVLPRHHGLSPTWRTELLPVLRARDIRTIVMAGVSLNVAIPLGVGEAVHDRFTVVVPRDAVVASPAEYGEQMLRNTIAMLARVVTVDDVIAAWATADRDAIVGESVNSH